MSKHFRSIKVFYLYGIPKYSREVFYSGSLAIQTKKIGAQKSFEAC